MSNIKVETLVEKYGGKTIFGDDVFACEACKEMSFAKEGFIIHTTETPAVYMLVCKKCIAELYSQLHDRKRKGEIVL